MFRLHPTMMGGLPTVSYSVTADGRAFHALPTIVLPNPRTSVEHNDTHRV